jgi:hypothetical protein
MKMNEHSLISFSCPPNWYKAEARKFKEAGMRLLMQKFVWVILSFFVAAFQVNAQVETKDKTAPKIDAERAYQTLLKVDLFALGETGYGGATSKGEEALDILLKENEPVPVLRKLIKEASPEGKLYGLLGLKILNCECFMEELNNIKNLPLPPARKDLYGQTNEGQVRRMIGCILFQENWADIVSNIENEKDEIEWKLNSWRKRQQ